MVGLTRQTGNAVTVSFVRTPDGQLIAATTGSTSAYYLTDNLQSTVGIVTSAGAKTASYSYDPYGRTRTATGPNAASNAFRYAGGLYDSTTGATKFGARYYDPNTGRFTQPDPSGQEQNRYSYTADEPIDRSDPTGHGWLSWVAVGLGVAAIGLGIASGVAAPESLAAAAYLAASTDSGAVATGIDAGCQLADSSNC